MRSTWTGVTVMGAMLLAASCSSPPSLVDSIDANSEPGGPEEKQLYRHIERDWYLFYRSSN